MAKILVNTPRPYDVLIEPGILRTVGPVLAEIKDPCHICIVADTYTHEKFNDIVEDSLASSGFSVHKTVFPRGESAKTMDCLQKLLEYLARENFSKSDMLLSLGGGTIGDLTGFAAATYLRGVEYMQVPTTLLAAVDSSVGGKTAINLSSGKNLAGAVWQPSLVLFDEETLESLPNDEFLSGLAEVIKTAVIGNATLFEYISTQGSHDFDLFVGDCVEESVKVKRDLVERDENDNDLRQLLNLGHTMAHAIEQCSDYKISHGRAVAIGMRACAKASWELKWSQDNCYGPINRVLNKYGFDLECPYDSEQLARAALSDKKRRGDIITLSIPLTIGECSLVQIPVTQLKDFFDLGLGIY